MVYQVLQYHTIEGYVEKRKPFRKSHFDHIQKYVNDGTIALGGALGDPAHEALIVFHGDDPSIAENFAKSDPYVINGMVHKWEVKPWIELVSEIKKA